MESPNIAHVTALVTHVSRTAAVRFEINLADTLSAFRPQRAAASTDEVSLARYADVPLAIIISAFRTQLAVAAPEQECRKWSLYCGFEDWRGDGKLGRSRTCVPPFAVKLPKSVTSSPSMLTPSVSADHSVPGVLASSVADGAGFIDLTLGKLLLPFVPPAAVGRVCWCATLSFVLGEDDEERRKRRAEGRAAMVVVSQPKDETALSEETKRRIAADRARGDMMVHISTLLGEHTDLRVTKNANVKDFKALIEDHKGYKASQHMLIFGGKQMEDHHSLADYNVIEHAKIHLVMRM